MSNNNIDARSLIPGHLVLDGATIQVVEVEVQRTHTTRTVRVEFLIKSPNRAVETLASSLSAYFDNRQVELPQLGRLIKIGDADIFCGGEAEMGYLQATVQIYFRELAAPPPGLVDLGDRAAQGPLLEGR